MQVNHSSTSIGMASSSEANQRLEAKATASPLLSAAAAHVRDIGQEILLQSMDSLFTHAFYAGMQNPLLGKLISGVVCTGTGSYCLLKSQVPQHLFHLFSQALCSASDSASQTRAKRSWTGFALGALAFSYGTYNLVSVLVDVWTNACESDIGEGVVLYPSLHASSDAAHQKLECQEGEESVSIHEAVSLVLHCPASARVLDEIRQRGESVPHIKEVREEHFPYAHFYGSWAPAKQTVFVRQSLCKHKLSVLLFEILNASKKSEMDELMAQGLKGKVSQEAYTKRLEEIEFENRKLHHQIVRQCIQTSEWDPEIDIFASVTQQFHVFGKWWEGIKYSPHADLFREQWDNALKAPYCEKSPTAPECQADHRPRYQRSSSYTWQEESKNK